MKISNLFVILILLFLSLNAFALTYRSDLNNGTWSEYINYNTEFETNFNLTTPASNISNCDGSFCIIANGGNFARVSDDVNEGNYSGLFTLGSNGLHRMWLKDLNAGGKTITFSYKLNANLSAPPYDSSVGYITGNDDSYSYSFSNYVRIQNLSNSNTWKFYSITIPEGNNRLVLNFDPMNGATFRIDDLKVDGVSYSLSYLQPDSQRTFFNRNLDSNVNIQTSSTTPVCDGSFCAIGIVDSASITSVVKTDSTYTLNGERSLYAYKGYLAGCDYPQYNCSGTNRVIIYSQNERTAGAYVSLYFKTSSSGYTSTFDYGYINDSNVFTAIGTYTGNVDWTYLAYKIPSNAKSYALKPQVVRANGQPDSYGTNFYFSNIQVSRNYAGTFFKGTSAPSCSSVSTCSNLNNASLLKSNTTRNLYWIADYVAGATCNVYENSVFKGNMIEMSSGMYYYEIESKAYPANDVNVLLYATCSKLPYASKGFIANPQIFNDSNIQTTLIATNSLTNNEGFRGDIVTFYSSFKDDLGSIITDGTCTLTIDGSTNSMTYNSSLGKYTYSKGFITDGIYPTTHSCTKGNYQSQTSSYSINIGTPLVEILTFTPLTNISSYSLLDSNVTMLNNTTTDITFKAVGSEIGTAKFVWTNPDRTKNYLIYTSSDGINWTFNDSLTFGSTAYNGVQKIYSGNTYYWSFSDTITPIAKYYKLEIQTPELQWATIKDSSFWIKVSPAENHRDYNSINWDLFSNSESVSPILIYSQESFSTLNNPSFAGDYILRFTAFADITTTATLTYAVGDVDVGSITLTETPKTYNIPLSNLNGQFKLKGSASESFSLYVSDYTIIPRAYFIQSLSILDRFGNPLPSIVNGAVSTQYIQETSPFSIKTKAYNTSGMVRTAKVDVIAYQEATSPIIKTYSFDITDSRANSTINLNKVLEGVIYYLRHDHETTPITSLPQLYVNVTLIDSNGRSVAEQSASIGFLEYPYFANDVKVSMENLVSKVGKNPKFNFSLQQKNPSAFLGVSFTIYDTQAPTTSSTPIFTKTIYANELGCLSLYDCTKTITIDEYSYAERTDYSILANLILTTQEPEAIWDGGRTSGYLYQPLRTAFILPVYPSYTTMETARILQVFERTDHIYKPTEPIPLVVQLRNDEYTNMKDDFIVQMSLMDEAYNFGSVMNQPSKFIYDEVTGYNYWFFNNIFFDAMGGLFETGESALPIAYVKSLKQSTEMVEFNATLTDKCIDYPLDLNNFNPSTFLMSWFGLDPQYKCQTDAPLVITAPSGEWIDFNSSHSVASNQNQSIFCIKTDVNKEYNTTLGDDFVCGVLYRKSEEQIDKFSVLLGNSYSDYAKTGAEAQYISFEIPQEQIMFNDLTMMKSALDSSYTTDRIDTLGEFLSSGFNKILPNFQGGTDFIQDNLINTNILNWGAGMDLNLSEQLNPNYISGAFFFKITGLQVTNMNDYVKTNPSLKTLNPSEFRTWAINHDLELPNKTALIQIYSSDMKQTQALEVASPLIIFENESKTIKQDENNYSVIPTTMKFNFIVDMTSANFMKTMRGYVPLSFSYAVPPAPFNAMQFVTDILYGTDSQGNPQGIINNPPKFFFNNWFIFLIIGIVILWASVVFMNFTRGGGNNTNINIRK